MPITEMQDGSMRRKMLLVFGRQSEKSTTVGNLMMSMANLQTYLRLLYVTASNEQMREFSDERLRAVINDSPVLQRMAGQLGERRKRDGKETQNVQTKRWATQSKIVLRSVFKSPDRVRGISSDFLACDEIQDIYVDFLPVIEEVLFACQLDDGPMSVYSGTPKTFDNALEFYWSRKSTQNEWMVRCERCGKWSAIEDDNIGRYGLICMKPRRGKNDGICGGPLEPVHGKAQWVRHGREFDDDGKRMEWEGFRLPQPVVIYTSRERPDTFERRWEGLLYKQRDYSRPKFANEVMARSFDAGTKPVTLEQVRRCALPDKEFVLDPWDGLRSSFTFAGVDWGTGDQSFTVLSIWHYDSEGRFALLFGKIYRGREADPDYSIQDIIKTCKSFNVDVIGADYGFGFHANPKLMKAFGVGKVALYAHVDRQNDLVRYDKMGHKFTTHRSRVMQMVFTLIERGPKPGGCVFPKWDIMQPFSEHILSIYSEYSESRRQLIYNHAPGNPDDFFHTMVYALLASMMVHERRDLIQPGLPKR